MPHFAVVVRRLETAFGRCIDDENGRARTNWKAFVMRNRLGGFDSLSDVVTEVRGFLLAPLEHVRTVQAFDGTWSPGGPWV